MQTLIIGRDATNQIVLNDSKVSRRHAQLTIQENGQAMIKDLDSINGTFVNGNRVTEKSLNNGDIVKCGSVFLNWAQYLNLAPAPGEQINHQQPVPNQSFIQKTDSTLSVNPFNLGYIFKYLATGIFEIGDLFKTNWDKTTAILFLKIVPVFLTLICSAILFSKLEIGFYFSPTVLALFIFAICPFITVYLLSISRNVSLDKVALASGIAGFLQFGNILCDGLFSWICYSNFQNNDVRSIDIFPIMILLISILVHINLAIAILIFSYKYFISIGFERSRSIYLVFTAFVINLFFQILSTYIIYLVVKDSLNSLKIDDLKLYNLIF